MRIFIEGHLDPVLVDVWICRAPEYLGRGPRFLEAIILGKPYRRAASGVWFRAERPGVRTRRASGDLLDRLQVPLSAVQLERVANADLRAARLRA